MKESSYNYIVTEGDKTIVFNGISEKFFEIRSSHWPFYKEMFADPDSYYDSCRNFMDKMLEDGFVINIEDEKSLIEEKYQKLRRPDEYYLMILPTYQCNLRCWYCIQKHENLWMSDETVERIKLHISNVLSDSGIKTLRLFWFGGEPTLSYDTMVEITRHAQNKAALSGKQFTCDITTNGTLLNPDRIEELRRIGVTSYQITIDGKKEYHDKVKHLSNESSFEKTVGNIECIARHTNCCVRLNYTNVNLDPESIISDLCNRLDMNSRKKVNFLIYKVWQEDEKSIDKGKLRSLLEKSKQENLHPRLARSGMCYVDQKYFTCIFPDGSVGKCDNENPIHSNGVLTQDGIINWRYPNGITALEHEETECDSCRYLPLCWGPCYAKRERMLSAEGKIRCAYADKDDYMEGIVRNIVSNIKLSTES